MKRISLMMLFGLFLTISLTGCNAWRGAGKDMSDTGQHIQNTGH